MPFSFLGPLRFGPFRLRPLPAGPALAPAPALFRRAPRSRFCGLPDPCIPGHPVRDCRREHPIRYAVLLTCLALAPAPALAQLRFEGEARFGVSHDSSSKAARIESRYGLDSTASTTSDGGLTFGAQVRVRAGNGRAAAPNGPRYFVTTGTPLPPPRER
ncbi:porin [Pseudooceanicola sp. 216_PA32_1]|uniref:Porin n=1 Tax=Pseudooceanicola pacificus TaxID=2676438 RepID=A0A844W0D9_9RHOB|nr:porin [Pseudooceanicola pacificus]